ncbi:MAG TPA: hypothetical protein VGQ40_00325, partial [Chthoniobacterales bacterium]|nr:hypothetical protein [Chthoniobacterales bacterium]
RRFLPAIEALEELFAAVRRGRKAKWDKFRLMLLWIYVEALMKTKSMNVSSACAHLAKCGPRLALGNRESALVRRYWEADQLRKNDPDLESEWRYEAGVLAGSQALPKIKQKF